MAGVEVGTIEQRKAALQRQGQELDRRLVEIDRQRGQVIANLNAVSGALQLCEDLLKTTADSRQPAAEPGLTLEQLKERIGADSVEVVEGDGTPAVDQR